MNLIQQVIFPGLAFRNFPFADAIRFTLECPDLRIQSLQCRIVVTVLAASVVPKRGHERSYSRIDSAVILRDSFPRFLGCEWDGYHQPVLVSLFDQSTIVLYY